MPGLHFPVVKTPARDKLQIQDDFQSTSLSSLNSLGLKLYDLLPDFRDCCPVCQGAVCAVRHGLYFRRVVDLEGRLYEAFGVPRFLCRHRGPVKSRHVTFSVLPSELVARRRFSLALMKWIVQLVGEARRTLSQVLDQLAAEDLGGHDALVIDELAVQRILLLFSGVYARLQSFPLDNLSVTEGLQTIRSQAFEVAKVVSPAEPRGSPTSLVLDFHRHYFPYLLFDIRLSG